MATRRSFLLSAGLAPAALSAAPAGSPIAQLKNRRAEAQPISTAERRARIERAQQLMVGNKIAAGPVTGAHVYTWQEDESPYALAAFGLKEAGLLTGKIGIEETTPFV